MSLSWEVISGIAAVVAAVFAFPSVLTGIRDLLSGSRNARQQVLTVLPTFPSRPNNQSMQTFLMANGTDWSTLVGSLAVPVTDIQKAMQQLIKERRVQVAIISGIADNSHPGVPAGIPIKIPLFFKGGIDPSVRATDEEVEQLMNDLRPH
jgi:hypothetical protein